MTAVHLRNVEETDLDAFFKHQLDDLAHHMAAFTSSDPSDRAAFDRHWRCIMSGDSVMIRTVEADGQVAGHVLTYQEAGQLEVSYWIGREFWGRGVATEALRRFLAELPERPLFARSANDNLASLRVLQKCGFVEIGHDISFANARGEDTPETILRLD